MKVINLFASPGTGKSTTGQILSGLLSIADYKVEYIPEFAKFATFSKNTAALSDQIYMFAKQENRLNVLKDANLDYVIMDGPLPIALLFAPEDYYKGYEPLVLEVFNSFDNLNFFLKRNAGMGYKQEGRNENEKEAFALEQKLLGILDRHAVAYEEFEVNKTLPHVLFEHITRESAPIINR